jgi:hypothetical protein
MAAPRVAWSRQGGKCDGTTLTHRQAAATGEGRNGIVQSPTCSMHLTNLQRLGVCREEERLECARLTLLGPADKGSIHPSAASGTGPSQLFLQVIYSPHWRTPHPLSLISGESKLLREVRKEEEGERSRGRATRSITTIYIHER